MAQARTTYQPNAILGSVLEKNTPLALVDIGYIAINTVATPVDPMPTAGGEGKV